MVCSLVRVPVLSVHRMSLSNKHKSNAQGPVLCIIDQYTVHMSCFKYKLSCFDTVYNAPLAIEEKYPEIGRNAEKYRSHVGNMSCMLLRQAGFV